MEQKKFHVNLAVLATGMMSFAGVLIETAMNVTFPTLIKEFGITTSQVQWVTTIYL
ncbi:MAG: MFS transporter, partial [Vagococcus fluvialis]